jgi:hypothetical protein
MPTERIAKTREREEWAMKSKSIGKLPGLKKEDDGGFESKRTKSRVWFWHLLFDLGGGAGKGIMRGEMGYVGVVPN